MYGKRFGNDWVFLRLLQLHDCYICINRNICDYQKNVYSGITINLIYMCSILYLKWLRSGVLKRVPVCVPVLVRVALFIGTQKSDTGTSNKKKVQYTKSNNNSISSFLICQFTGWCLLSVITDLTSFCFLLLYVNLCEFHM